MKDRRDNRRMRLSCNRALVTDLLRQGKRGVLIPVLRQLRLPELAALRLATRPRVSWTAVLMKAYAAVALRNPPLRQVYVGLPCPHLYQHSANTCFVTIIRQWEGEDHLFYGRFPSPEGETLAALQQRLTDYQTRPVEESKQFRHQITLGHMPFPLRWLTWFLTMNVSPRIRMKNLGTFGMSITNVGASGGLGLIGPYTSLLGYGELRRNGEARLVCSFDHRVMDGIFMFRAMAELEAELDGPIADELRGMTATGEVPT